MRSSLCLRYFLFPLPWFLTATSSLRMKIVSATPYTLNICLTSEFSVIFLLLHSFFAFNLCPNCTYRAVFAFYNTRKFNKARGYKSFTGFRNRYWTLLSFMPGTRVNGVGKKRNSCVYHSRLSKPHSFYTAGMNIFQYPYSVWISDQRVCTMKQREKFTRSTQI